MDPAIVAGLVAFVLVIVIGWIATVWVGSSGRGGSYSPSPTPVSQDPACLLCRRTLRPSDQVVGYNEQAVRELLGRMPTDRPAGTDPSGQRRWLAHVVCADSAGTDLSTAVPISGDPPPAGPQPATSRDLTCPACGRRFTPPDIMVITEADARKYGPDPVQCPHCDHIWNAGRDIRRIRG
jgi:hypothetical protein